MEWVVIWFLFGIVTAVVAHTRGVKYVLGWFFIGALLGPFGLLLAIFVAGRRCPKCQSRIHKAATRCPKCQADLTPTVVTTAAAG
jgi:hypothetical protein